MAITESTYYALTRIREQSPEGKDWATVDKNPEVISLLLKALEQHAHTGTPGIRYPGYDPTTPILPALSVDDVGGILSPGTTIGTRLAYVNSQGLETDASSETTITIPPATGRPLAPRLASTQVYAGGIPGGTYLYVLTKKKGSGETVISDVLPVEIPYDNTYSVTLIFDDLTTYAAEGADGINIYRSSGLASSFQLITTITVADATTFTDTNSIPPANVNVQPPTNNTFDAGKKVRIDWSAFTHPPGATALRVYITQQAGLWSTDHLLSEVDLTGTPTNYIDYLGSETLASGWPLNSSQVPSSPSKINLGSETVGAPQLTADMDFNGYKANELVLGNFSQNVDGALWYDSTTKTFKGYSDGAQMVLSPPVMYTNYVWNPSGELNAAYWSATSGVTISTVNDNTAPSGGKVLRFTYAGTLNASTLIYFQTADTLTTLTNTSQAMAINNTSEIHFARASFRLSNLDLTSTATVPYIRVYISYFDSAGTFQTSVQVAEVHAGLQNGVWYNLSGFNSGTNQSWRYAVVRLYVANGNAVSGTPVNVDIDSVMLTKVGSTSETPAYFDGDTVGAQWQGPPHGARSASGAFQHGVEEAGGHKAENITFPGGTNVATLLGRLFDPTTGARTQVQLTGQALGTTSSPAITDTADHMLDQMQVVITPQFAPQWIRIDFTCSVQLSIPAGSTYSTFTASLGVNGTRAPRTDLAQDAVRDGQNLAFSGTYYYNATSTTPITFSILGRVSAGATATLVQTNRLMTASLVF